MSQIQKGYSTDINNQVKVDQKLLKIVCITKLWHSVTVQDSLAIIHLF